MVAEVQQQQQVATEGTAGPGSSATAATSAAPAAAMLSIASFENGKLRLLYQGISQLTLSAYQIDTELLFTTQPFSSLSAGSGSSGAGAAAAAACPLPPLPPGRGDGDRAAAGDSDGGLGKVGFVQPTARVVLQLPLQEGSTASAAAVSEGPSADAAAASGAGAGVLACVLDVDALLPHLASQSVLLEVSGGGISRTLPR